MDRGGCVRRLVSMLGFSLLLMLMCIVPLGASTMVHLAWDANTEVDLAGYRLLYGTTSGSYTDTIEIGNLTTYDVIDLAAGTTFYFVVVAYDDAGNVSAHSNEVSVRPTVLAPQPVISVTDAPDPVAAGSTITYTIGYSNAGNVDATGVTITDPVPLNTAFVAATGGGTLSGGVVTWSVGTLAAGSSGSVQMVVRAASGLSNGTIITNGSYALRSNESASVGGPSVTTTVTSTPVLAILSTDSPDPVAAGATLTYTISYSNTGNATATGLVVSDTIPANTTFVSAAGGAVPQSGVVSWPLGILAAGASGSVQLVVRVGSPLANGTVITNATYSVDSDQTAPVSGAPVATTVTGTSSPTVDSTVELTSGSIYILRPGVQDIRVVGTEFQGGATLTLSADVISGPTTFIDSTQLTATITVSPTASLGPISLTVTNPDRGSGTKNHALKVVKSPDCNGNCRTDGLDLNTLARTWGLASIDVGFNAEADLNGDNLIDGEDLDILATFFGRESTACP